MRVLVTTDTVGGVWTYTRELAEGLLQAGYEVLLVSLGRMPAIDQQSWSDATERQWGAGFRFQALPFALEWMQSNQDCYEKSAPALLRAAEEFGPDILHFNQFCYGALPVSAPKLVVAHSDVLSWHQAVYGCLPEPSPWYSTYLHLVQEGLRGATAVVAPTRWMLGAVRSNFGLPANARVIPNARTYSPAPQARRKLQAVSIGRLWDPGKGIAILQDVESGVPIVVAGDTQLDGAGFRSKLISLGRLDEFALAALLGESAIYVASSLYEPFGLAPLEAALAGCALVLRNIASLEEVWADTALYFSDSGELGAVLDELASKPVLLQHYAHAAQERALALYTPERMIASYTALYDKLTQTTSARAQHVA